VYIVSRMQLRLRLFPRWQQAVIMNLLALIYLGLLFWVQGLVSQPPMIWRYWFPMFTTGLCWPVIVQLLSRFQYRLGVH